MRTFAKNTAHSERRFKINAYLCTRGGRTAAVTIMEAFSFFQTDESRQLIWKNGKVRTFFPS